MDEDGFQIVSRKKAAKSNKTKPCDEFKYSINITRNIDPADRSTIEIKLEKRSNEVLQSEFWNKLFETLDDIQLDTRDTASRITDHTGSNSTLQESPICLVCYGIGEFADNLISSYQMALLLALRSTFQVPKSQCLVYDPVFCETEKKIIQTLTMEIIESNEEAKRLIEKKTLFFMPHCGKPLYNNLLWKNWSINTLSKLYILGNSFSSMIERTPRRILEKEANYILKIEAFMEESKIQNSFEHKDIFNDMAFIKFPYEKLVQAPAELWTDITEPVYCDEQVEIITNKD